MNTKHKVIFGNCMSMTELPDQSIHLIVISPQEETKGKYRFVTLDYIENKKKEA